MFCRIVATLMFAGTVFSPGLSCLGQSSYIADLQWKFETDAVILERWRLAKPLHAEVERRLPQTTGSTEDGCSAEKELVDKALVKKRQREIELRTNAAIQDQVSGEALNSVYSVLIDPNIAAELWNSQAVALPENAVNEIYFRYVPVQGQQPPMANPLQFSVSGLRTIEVSSWPQELAQDDFTAPREALQVAYRASTESLKKLDPNHPQKAKGLGEAVQNLGEAIRLAKSNGRIQQLPVRYLREIERLQPSFEYVFALRNDTSGTSPSRSKN